MANLLVNSLGGETIPTRVSRFDSGQYRRVRAAAVTAKLVLDLV